jgi:hypothetical protein
MRIVKDFNEFIEEGVVRKQTPDISRARFLFKESEKSFSFLNDIVKGMGVTDSGANSIVKLCYDIIMELVRAKMLLNGFSASGQGAHGAEVAYLRELNFSENDIRFANQLRYLRNGIVYYGKVLDKEYAKKVLEFMNRVYPELKRMVENEIKKKY